jgi:hypothetical protein
MKERAALRILLLSGDRPRDISRDRPLGLPIRHVRGLEQGPTDATKAGQADMNKK